MLPLPSSSLLLIVGHELSCFSSLGTGESFRGCEFLLASEKCPFKLCVYNIYFSTTAFPGLSFSTRRLGGGGRAVVCFRLHVEETSY